MELLEAGGYGGARVAGVEEEEVSLVKPVGRGAGSGYGSLYLSSLDLCWRGTPYSRRILFYETVGTPAEQTHMVDTLKRSLSQLLLAFYPAAGRLVSAHPSARPSILCNGQGVEFIVARVNVRLSHLQASNFEPCSLFHSLARSYPPAHVPQHLLPLLSLQVTKFACGGLAIGISCSNVLADGHSIWHLMISWAECARNEAISVTPCHNRESFKCKDAFEHLATQFSLPRHDILAHEEELAPITSTMHKVLHINPSMINGIREQISKEHSGEGKMFFSDYDLFCALMWKSIIGAQSLTRVKHSSTNMCVLGDMRFRMSPPLPRGYFGNAAIFNYASSTVRDIEEGSFDSIAQKIHQACKGCNESRLWRIVSWLERHGNVFDEKSLPWIISCINVVSSPKFKIRDVDFGWGKPVAVRTCLISNPRDMVLFPGHGDGGIDICVSCPNPAMYQLMQNFTRLTS